MEQKQEQVKIESVPLRQLLLEKYPNFFDEIDTNLKIFAKEIRRELRNEGHVVIAVTGYPGKGKSNDTSIISAMVDERYNFDENICFIPTSKEIENQYLTLPIYSVLHIDEASKSLHKHKWHERVQQKLNELYDTDREGHFLCTFLLMPRFQNFTENFRNFMIKYWIDIPKKGLAVFYIKDEDKDIKDPWHMDESYKLKKIRWRGKRVFERSIGDKISMEQRTECYWFYCEIPPIPKDIWEIYQRLKKQSRVDARAKEPELETENYKAQLERKKFDRWNQIVALKKKGLTQAEMGVIIGISTETIRRDLRGIEAWKRMAGSDSKPKKKIKLN